AGPATNWLLAAFFVFFLAVTVGFLDHADDSTVVGELVPEQPAAMAGFAPGDRIIAINGEAVSTWSGLVERIRRAGGERLDVEVRRGGEILTLQVKPAIQDGVGYLGIAPEPVVIRLPPGRAVVE